VVLLIIPAPYGRVSRSGWGPQLSSRLGWTLMEAPARLLFFALFLAGPRRSGFALLLLSLLWIIHYVDRTVFFPLRLRGNRQHMTLVTVLLGVFFNAGNAYLNGRHLFHLGSALPTDWPTDPRFLAGILLFVVGFVLNKSSDQSLIGLRAPGESGYRIPEGGAFRWVSCPNYLGKIVEWGGWALACWNLPGAAFFLWTTANLGPRAVSTHPLRRRSVLGTRQSRTQGARTAALFA